MSVVVINRRRNGDIANPKTIPNNIYQIKENNTKLSVALFLKNHPLTEGISSTLEVINNEPDNESITLDFVGQNLSTSQQDDAIAAAEEYRDKLGYSPIELINIDAKEKIDSAVEEIGDVFDEDNIDSLLTPDFFSFRNEVKLIYDTQTWANLTYGEKRILIADWAIGSQSERVEIFPGGNKRRSIYKLFSYKLMSILQIEFIRRMVLDIDDYDNSHLSELMQSAVYPSKHVPQTFISRNDNPSLDADLSNVELPIFENVRVESSFLEVLSITRATFTRDGTYEVTINTTVNAPNAISYRLTGRRVRNSATADIDGNMKGEERGRGNITLIRTFDFKEGDEVFFELSRLGANNGSVIARANMSCVTIKEVP